MCLYKKRGFILVGPKNIFFYFFMIDTIYLLLSLKIFLQYSFGIKLESNLVWCKIYTYISFSLSSIPIWLTVYITFERYISFRNPKEVKFLRSQRNQRTLFIFLIISNFIYYIPVLLSSDKETPIGNNLKNNFLTQYNCVYYSNLLLMWLLIKRMIIPFSVSIFFSVLLVRIIYKQKANYFINNSFKECARFKKEVKASLVSISINLIMILLNFPLFIAHFFFSDLTSLYLFTFYLFLLNYGIKYYLIILTEKLFCQDKCTNFILKIKSEFISI